MYTRAWGEDYGFYDVLMRLKLRKRKFYATRHTFISWALTEGGNAYGIAKHCDTSVEMIEKNYGKYMPAGGLDPRLVEALAGVGELSLQIVANHERSSIFSS